jgi:hypothetical protein
VNSSERPSTTNRNPAAYIIATRISETECGSSFSVRVRITAISSRLRETSSPAESPERSSAGAGRSSSVRPAAISCSRIVS